MRKKRQRGCSGRRRAGDFGRGNCFQVKIRKGAADWQWQDYCRFCGAAADGITLIERLEEKLEKHANQLKRAAVELAKDWRMDKYLRQLQAYMIVADKDISLVISGTGEVMEPDDGIIGIGSGGNYAMAAAKALYDIDGLSAEDIARRALKIAGDIDIYTNHNVVVEKVV